MNPSRYMWYTGELVEVEAARGDFWTVRIVRENISLVVLCTELEPIAREDLEALADVYNIDLTESI